MNDDAGALVGDVALLELRGGDRLLHGDVVPGATLVKEAHGATVDQLGRVERRRAPHLALETVLGEIVGEGDAEHHALDVRTHGNLAAVLEHVDEGRAVGVTTLDGVVHFLALFGVLLLHGGEVTVNSELGKGTIFTIHLPKR